MKKSIIIALQWIFYIETSLYIQGNTPCLAILYDDFETFVMCVNYRRKLAVY